MYTIIGKIKLCVFFIAMPLCATPVVTVHIRDTQSYAIEQVAAGKPFNIEIVVKDASSNTQMPIIEGLEKFNARRSGVFMTSINGTSTNKYVYTLRIDTPGSYTLGPVQVRADNTVISVDPIVILVDTHTVIKKDKKKKEEVVTSFELILDKEKVVIGQQVNARLRFYYNDETLQIKDVAQPVLTDIVLENVTNGKHATYTKKKMTHHYIEWEWQIYPLKEGKITIPAYSAHYYVQKKNNSAHNNFFMFMQPTHTLHTTYSNAVVLQVDPLPLYKNKPVDAVGSFTSFSSKVSPGVLKEGEATTLTLSVHGQGHINGLQAPLLSNMCSEIKWYESKNYVESDNNNRTHTKNFEYICHPTQTGEWEIPPQEFVFYDPHTNQFKKLKSNKQTITVLKNNSLVEKTNETHKNVVQMVDNSLPIILYGRFADNSSRILPFSLFLIFMSVPFLFELLAYIQKKKRVYTQGHYLNTQSKYAFKKAYGQLNDAQEIRDYKNISTIFIHLIAHRSYCSVNNITEDFIIKKMESLNFDNKELHNWTIFYQALMHYAYHEEYTPRPLFWREVYYWVDRFKEKGL